MATRQVVKHDLGTFDRRGRRSLCVWRQRGKVSRIASLLFAGSGASASRESRVVDVLGEPTWRTSDGIKSKAAHWALENAVKRAVKCVNTTHYCECGCGQYTRRGRSGKPNRFIRGHNAKRGMGGRGWINQGHRYVSVGGRAVAEHRLIAERSLGRKLRRDEVVHHIDGDPLNNAAENLQVPARGIAAKRRT